MVDLHDMAKAIAGLSDEEIDRLADGLVDTAQPKADRLSTVIGWNLQDRQIRKEETMLEKTTATSGTHLQGKFIMPFDALMIALGDPHYTFDVHRDVENKIDVEWAFELPSGKVATVYNWKDGHAYNGAQGTPVENITCWHVGGHEMDAMHELVDIINKRLDDANYKLNVEGAYYG